MSQNRAEELAEAHWQYIQGVLETGANIAESVMRMVEYHYKTAMIHGYKHGVEDANKSRD